MNHWQNNLDNGRLIRYLLLFALGWAISQLLSYFASVLIVFIFAAIFAFLLDYPVSWLQQRRMPRTAAVAIVFLLALLILGGVAFTLGLTMLSQAQELLDDAPEYLNSFAENLAQLEDFLRQRNLQLNLEAIERQLRQQAFVGLEFGFVTLQRFLFSLFDFVLVIVLTFFMLLNGASLWHYFLGFFPAKIQERLPSAIRQNFLGFFWGRFLLSLFFGFSTFIVFVLLQLPYPLILATVAGLFDLIPGIGATLGISLISLFVLPQSIWLSLKVLVGCVLLQQIEENLLMPRIMQGSVNLNPVVLFLALLMGAKVAGLFGVFISIPLAGTLIKVFEIEEMEGG